MKKAFLLSVLGLFVFIACNKKAVPTGTTTAPNDKTAAEKTAVTDTVSKVTPAADMSPVAGMSNEAQIANGETIFKTKCTKCHGLKNTADYTSDRWDSILKTMIPRAKLDGTEQYEVLAYIKANCKK